MRWFFCVLAVLLFSLHGLTGAWASPSETGELSSPQDFIPSGIEMTGEHTFLLTGFAGLPMEHVATMIETDSSGALLWIHQDGGQDASSLYRDAMRRIGGRFSPCAPTATGMMISSSSGSKTGR